MATNDFLPFGTGGGANVIDQATYAALAARTSGFQAGIAQAAQLNKVWRQASIIATAVAQFIVDQTGQSAVDDGTIATLESNLLTAIRNTSSFRNIQVFTSSGTFTVPANVTAVRVMVVGGGGGGGGCPASSGSNIAVTSGGNSGSYGIKYITGLTPGSTIPVTVGAGGTGGAAGSNAGGIGGTSSFGAYVSAPGGHGGGVATSNPQGYIISATAPTSVAVGADIVGRECPGMIGIGLSNGTSGNGAPGPFGGGGISALGGNGAGTAPVGWGSGAPSATSLGPSGVATAGLPGASGVVIVEW